MRDRERESGEKGRIISRESARELEKIQAREKNNKGTRERDGGRSKREQERKGSSRKLIRRVSWCLHVFVFIVCYEGERKLDVFW